MELPVDLSLIDDIDGWSIGINPDLDEWLDQLSDLAPDDVVDVAFIPPPAPDDAPWLRLKEEQPKHYRAFSDYLDLGVARSLARLLELYTNRHQSATKAAPTIRLRTLKDWSGKYEWQERVAAYDLWLEEQLHLHRQKQHIADLEEFRQRQKRVSAAATNVAVHMLALAGKKLKGVKEGDVPVDKIPGWVRAASTVAQTATNSEAVALGVGELTQLLDARDTDADD